MDMNEDVSDRQCFNIDISESGFYQGKTDCHSFTRSDRNENNEQLNGNTAFIDASSVYGSDPEIAMKLRTKADGLMRLHEVGSCLPMRSQCNLLSDNPMERPHDMVAGDQRNNVQPALASMHTMFLNEHNRVAAGLRNELVSNGHFDKLPLEEQDQLLYQEARKVVAAEMQNIVYSEYLPLILGSASLNGHGLKLPNNIFGTTRYNRFVKPMIRNEFSTVAYRFGHTLVNGFYQPVGPPRTMDYPLKFLFFDTLEFVLGEKCTMWWTEIKGLIEQPMATADTSVARDMTDFLFCKMRDGCKYGDDLVARNIQRGRDHGIPDYNTFREYAGLTKIPDMDSKPEEIVQDDWDNLRDTYEDVDQIDAYSAGMAETPLKDGVVGPTWAKIIGMQFKLLMDGDRFFFTHPASGNSEERGLRARTKQTIREQTLGDIVCANTNAESTRKHVMKSVGDHIACDSTERKPLNFSLIASDIIQFSLK